MKRLLSLLALAALSTSVLAEDGKLAVAGLNFAYPATWTSVPPTSPMRAGTLQIAVEGAEKPLEAVFYYFGAGQGGDAQANITRWLGQFASPPESKTEEIDANGTKVTLVTATGTYNDGPMMGPKTPKDNYTLLGAIVPGNDAPVFIKLTGPKDAVAKVSDSFKSLLKSPFPAK
ncbi:hypothetical protein [Brevifollis gellanilyticus]|uniref:DUF1795 domain-containing protein n=1 Tax=Brevifollis gellanilyticus TaxID=748831 RepID=A0A512MIS1_9BACT|nr:hypothetical protein [Brevifollis gellanilyticus]GEP46201.1 hypothetical protein BGE01nite_54920 [Brevifollis gellanilyticus]